MPTKINMDKKSNLRGYFDRYLNGVLTGWLYDVSDTNRYLNIKVFVDNKEVSLSRADLYREDLAANPAFNNTYHAYRVVLPKVLMDGKEHEIRVIEESSGYELNNSPLKALFNLDEATATPPARLDQALIGKDGWLFLCNDSNNGLGQYQGELKFTKKSLEVYVRQYGELEEYINALHMKYLMVIAPSKEFVYPEYLPDSITPSSTNTARDQFISTIQSNTSIELLDLRPVMLAQKTQGQLYYKTDSHWNYLGARVASAAIIKKLQQMNLSVSNFIDDDFELEVTIEKNTDLLNKGRLDYHNGKFVESVTNYDSTGARSASRVKFSRSTIEIHDHPYKDLSPSRPTRLFKAVSDSASPRAIFLRDSFCDWMIPILSEFFSEVLFIWKRKLDKHVVESFKPDLVVEQVVDRFLVNNRA